MIVVTGAAGFIGSRLAAHLNQLGREDLLLVDDFASESKALNWGPLAWAVRMERTIFPNWLANNAGDIEVVFHLGARTDTTEFDAQVFERLNVAYSQALWRICAQFDIPFFYASSAATYGDGALGYSDRLSPEVLSPLNPYGRSKNDFDAWALRQTDAPAVWAGFKFFNVYGFGEAHKGRMASVLWHTYRQVSETGAMRLFRSHREDVPDGGQKRDFVFVEDILKVLFWFFQNKPENGLYNLGTGRARTFSDLAGAVFRYMGLQPNIEFVDTPLDIRDTYQYYTCADLDKLRAVGYRVPFTDLEEGVGLTLALLHASI